MIKNKQLTCVRVGYGIIAPLHEQKLRELGVKTIGILDTRLERHVEARRKGLNICQTIEEAYQLLPDFWDICVSTHQHLIVLEAIIKLDPYARIIVEKPICQAEQIPRLESILKDFQGKIVVNENYRISAITDRVKDLLKKKEVVINEIAIEMSKNRIQDMKNGSYIDSNVFFYEGPHMLTILNNILGTCNKFEDIMVKYTDFEHLAHQGTADISFKMNNVPVNLFTSMIGEIKYSYPPHKTNNINVFNIWTRNRVLIVFGKEETIVGFYEPLEGFKRSQGAIGIYRGDQLMSYEAPVYDDTMGHSLRNCIEYFINDIKNPSPIQDAIEIVKMMHTLGPLC